MVFNVAVRNLEKYRKMLSILRECQFPCGTVCATLFTQVRWLQLGRPADEPPVVCRYKFQQVLTSRPRMYSLVLLERGGPYS